MTNEYQEIKSIVDAGYRLVVYPYCFLIVSGVGKIHILRQQDNPRRWIPFLSTILLGWLNTRHTLTLLSLYESQSVKWMRFDGRDIFSCSLSGLTIEYF